MTAVVEPGDPIVAVGMDGYAPGHLDSSEPQIVLPEPVANRAEAVPAGDALRWLREVAATDRHGFALLSGQGWTVVSLYAEGNIIAASRIRGSGCATGEATLRALADAQSGDAFAVAHRLRSEIARALSGLFAAPGWLLMTGSERTLPDILERLRVAAFTGAIHVGFDPRTWAIGLFDGGIPIASYGCDDRLLKPDLSDLTVLYGFDDLSVAVHPPLELDLQEAFVTPPGQAVVPTADNRDLITVESMLIEALAALEYGLDTVTGAPEDRGEGIALTLSATYAHLANAQVVIGVASNEDAPTHPLIAPFWSDTQRQINTERLLESLRLVTIPDAWLVAISALSQAIASRIAQQTAWLSQADATSASVLAETSCDLLRRARALASTTGSIGR